uniref:G_PROTEIN_RECEP_F1_2 domain-containing protein n=1 Tax=Steinernema glaseri TaxID=37863 RepID=A0A1I7YHE5_9BILA
MVLSFSVLLARLAESRNESSPEDVSCLSIDSVIRKRRHYDLTFSGLGLVFSTLHLVVLLYIRCVKRRKGFELLFTQASLSFLSLLFLVIGCLFDLCVFAPSPSLTFFRAHVWLFIVNSLIAAYSFLIIVLCIDRYVALTRPLYYRVQFVRYRIRLLMILGSFVLAVICALKWLIFNRMQDNLVVENEFITENWLYVCFRTATVVFQYFICGVVMVLLSICNVLRLRDLNRAHANELRMSERARSQWTRNHKVGLYAGRYPYGLQTIAKICSFLAISFVLFNWPYSLVDYFYADELLGDLLRPLQLAVLARGLLLRRRDQRSALVRRGLPGDEPVPGALHPAEPVLLRLLQPELPQGPLPHLRHPVPARPRPHPVLRPARKSGDHQAVEASSDASQGVDEHHRLAAVTHGDSAKIGDVRSPPCPSLGLSEALRTAADEPPPAAMFPVSCVANKHFKPKAISFPRNSFRPRYLTRVLPRTHSAAEFPRTDSLST